ncbi:MAG: hypothetical protein ACRC33_21770 [Gemmataceae bacterium]
MESRPAGSPALEELLRRLPLAPLGPGRPDPSARPAVEAACAGLPAACRAGLWLAFDFLDESHAISQDLETPEGSFWHAIMHQREPDAWNSKYWWRKVGAHPVLDRLVEQAPAAGYRFTDPSSFVDFVERVRDTGSDDEEIARRVQRLEWRLLFEHCRGAVPG